MSAEPAVAALVAGVRSGDRAALGRAITLIESERPADRADAEALLRAVLPASGGAIRVGVSGAPGVGKSTFVSSLGCRLVEHGRRVAVLAVDPSSSLTGGSILGDKTRMTELAASEAAFVRPSPSRGALGGVARSTRESIVVVEAAGYDVVLVETVGVGQSETVVAEMVDFFLVLLLAGGGDELQGIKRGILELADLLAVNKADGGNREAAERARLAYARALELLRPAGRSSWTPRVVACSALEGEGLDEVWGLVMAHRRLLEERGELAEKRGRQQLDWMWAILDARFRTAVREHPEVAAELEELESAVREQRTTPAEAAEAIFARVVRE